MCVAHGLLYSICDKFMDATIPVCFGSSRCFLSGSIQYPPVMGIPSDSEAGPVGEVGILMVVGYLAGRLLYHTAHDDWWAGAGCTGGDWRGGGVWGTWRECFCCLVVVVADSRGTHAVCVASVAAPWVVVRTGPLLHPSGCWQSVCAYLDCLLGVAAPELGGVVVAAAVQDVPQGVPSLPTPPSSPPHTHTPLAAADRCSHHSQRPRGPSAATAVTAEARGTPWSRAAVWAACPPSKQVQIANCIASSVHCP
jgi:hypothetical protein